MRQQWIEHVDNLYRKTEVPEVRVGDTVDVHYQVIEGNKTRTQIFNGVVIARRGRGLSETFTARRIVNNEGVERIFMLQSPRILRIEVKRRGKTRRAKLYFLRKRVGKARRLRELRRGSPKKSAETAELQPETPSKQATKPEPVGT